jgi:hypothetical protein
MFLHPAVPAESRHTAVGSVVVDFSTSWPGHLGVFAADDRTLVLPTSRLVAVDLGSPDLAVTLGPKSPARGAAVAVAAARSAGVVAWATDDEQVVWARVAEAQLPAAGCSSGSGRTAHNNPTTPATDEGSAQ